MTGLLAITAHRRAGMRFPAIAVCLVMSVALSTVQAQNPIDPAAEQQLLSLVNQERTKEGLPALTMDQRLTTAARKHSELMVQQDSLVHQLPGEDPLILRLRAEGVRADHDGENVALNGDVRSAHVALMESPGHRANILAPKFNAVGIGVVRSGELIYLTEDFAHVLPDFSDLEADAAAQQAITDYARGRGLPVPVRKVRTQLTRMACEMAQEDKIDSARVREIPGISTGVAWTATDLHVLPPGLKKVLAQPIASGYSLGVCFATSASQPGGVYWLIFITY